LHDACGIIRGGEGEKVIDGEASVDVLNGMGDFLDGE